MILSSKILSKVADSTDRITSQVVPSFSASPAANPTIEPTYAPLTNKAPFPLMSPTVGPTKKQKDAPLSITPPHRPSTDEEKSATSFPKHELGCPSNHKVTVDGDPILKLLTQQGNPTNEVVHAR